MEFIHGSMHTTAAPFLYGRHTSAVAIAVAATAPTKLVVAVFPPDVLTMVT